MSGHTSAIVSYLNSSYSGATFTAIEGSSTIHVEYTDGKVDWTPVTTEHLSFTYGSDDQEVSVLTLGSAYSYVELGGSRLTVPTSSLHWDTEMPESKQLAFIDAPKTGRASIHLKSSAKSLIVTKCSQGQVLAVISSGKHYTKVWYDGYVGYVLTDALTFCSHAVPDASVQLAYITFRGKIKSNNEINVRAEAHSSSRMLGTFKAGTQVVFFGKTDDGAWCEIEVNGIHCFVLSEYLTLASDLGV